MASASFEPSMVYIPQEAMPGNRDAPVPAESFFDPPLLPSCGCLPPAFTAPTCGPPPVPIPQPVWNTPFVPAPPLPCGWCSTCAGLHNRPCGRYNYGTSCGGGFIGPFPEAQYSCCCGIDKAKCCAKGRFGSCGLPCQAACYPGATSPGCCAPLCSDAKTCGFTEIGYCFSTDCYPITTYNTKSCARCSVDPFLNRQFAECTGCRASAVPLDRADDDQTTAYLPQPSSMNLEDKFHHQRRESAFERPTTWTNNSIGIAPFTDVVGAPLPPCGTTKNSQMGWNHGLLHGDGCKSRTCNQDPFYHPRTTVTVPEVSRYYRLYARRTLECARLQYAVAPMGVCDPLLTVLPWNPRTPPGCCYYANVCGTDADIVNRGIVELQSGDQIYLYCAGERGQFIVHMYADSSGTAGALRQSNSVFRGWGPVRKNPDEVRRHTANSGLRNFTATPGANGLLRPW